MRSIGAAGGFSRDSGLLRGCRKVFPESGPWRMSVSCRVGLVGRKSTAGQSQWQDKSADQTVRLEGQVGWIWAPPLCQAAHPGGSFRLASSEDGTWGPACLPHRVKYQTQSKESGRHVIDLPGNPVVKIPHFHHRRLGVRSLVREVLHALWCGKKKKKKNIWTLKNFK